MELFIDGYFSVWYIRNAQQRRRARWDGGNNPNSAAKDLRHPREPIRRPRFGGLMAATARIDDHHLTPEG